MTGVSARGHRARKKDTPDEPRGSGNDSSMVSGLKPLTSPDCRVLILGSFPSAISLCSGEYYANPRNQFWEIMSGIVETSPTESYQARTAALLKHGIGLWDVYQSCIRKGSLDSMIQRPTLNDIAGLLRTLPSVSIIALNGRKSEQGWIQWTRTLTPGWCPSVRAIYLPSTSPANTLPLTEKRRTWEELMISPNSEMPD